MRSTLSILSLLPLPLTLAEIFTITVSKTGSPLDGQVVQAAAQNFFLGLSEPGTYCPKSVGSNLVCPNATQTVITERMTALWVESPNGQSIYVDGPTGALAFTNADIGTIPTGGIQGGFFNLTYVSDCSAPKTVLNWLDSSTGSQGLLACPDIASDMKTTKATYQLYAKTSTFSLTDCIEIDGFAPAYTGNTDFGAWEYQ